MIMIRIHKAWLKTKTELKKSFAVEFCITNHTHLIRVLLIKLYAYLDLVFKMHLKLSVVISHKENNTWTCFLFIVIFSSE